MGKSWIASAIAVVFLMNGIAVPAAESPAADRLIICTRPTENLDHGMPPLLDRELIRQSFLMAARDDLGLYTRDEVLGETAPVDMDSQSAQSRTVDLAISINPKGDQLNVEMKGPNSIKDELEIDIPMFPRNPQLVAAVPDLAVMSVQMESMTKTRFADWLKDAKFNGEAKPAIQLTRIPDDLETRLTELTIFSQYDAVRKAHNAIREQGVSPAMLEVLVRGYANLGQITRFLWNADSEVFTARSMLYASRLITSDSGSPRSHWVRAYALALAGLHARALDELARFPAGHAPPWVEPIEPLCKYQTDSLQDLTLTIDAKYADLARLMMFLTVENSNRTRWISQTGKLVVQASPFCDRVADAMSDKSGVSYLSALSDAGLKNTVALYRQELPRIGDLPSSIQTQWQAAHTNPDLNADVADIADAFSKATAGDVEPSWNALGQMLKDANFVHAYRMADFLAYSLGSDPNDAIESLTPLADGNPFFPLLTAINNRFHKRPLPGELLRSIPTADATFRLPYLLTYFLGNGTVAETTSTTGGDSPAENRAGSANPGARPANQLFAIQCAHISANAWDCERNLLTANKWIRDGKRAPELTVWLRTISPYSPVGPAEMVRAGPMLPNPEQFITDMNRQFGKQPAFTQVLTAYYMNRHEYDKASVFLQPIVSNSGDRQDYLELAKCYLFLNKEDLWLSTMTDSLKLEDSGLDGADTQRQIAEHFMSKMEYQTARQYADAAADSGSAWGMDVAAKCHTGLADWNTAGQLIKDSIDRYNESPAIYYEWCAETGHGDMATARQMVQDAIQKSPGSRKEAFYDLAEGNPEGEYNVVHALYDKNHAPFVALWLITLDDNSGNQAEVDEVLQEMKPGGKAYTDTATEEALALQQCAACLREMRNPRGDAAVQNPLDKLMQQIQYAQPTVQSQIRYFIGMYRLDHGDQDGLKDLVYCSLNHTIISDAGFMARMELKKHGIDPWNPVLPATRPATQPASHPPQN